MSQTEALPAIEHRSQEERVTKGREARKALPRSELDAFQQGSTRADPVALLRQQEETRVPDLVELRHERMLASPFAFFRGAAIIMAADVASLPQSGLRVQCCGDAHLVNFGGFASPDRTLVFDINDFDETSAGPFEWDVKRLAASLQIAAQARGFTDQEARAVVQESARSYRQAMHGFADMNNLDVWYARLDIDRLMQQFGGQVSKATRARVERAGAKAEGRTSLKAFDKLTQVVDGEVRFTSDPPLLVPLRELFGGVVGAQFTESLHELFRVYRRSLQPDRRHLVEDYRIVDVARKVVGKFSLNLILTASGGFVAEFRTTDGRTPCPTRREAVVGVHLGESRRPDEGPLAGSRARLASTRSLSASS